jgi:hypothetical protein
MCEYSPPLMIACMTWEEDWAGRSREADSVSAEDRREAGRPAAGLILAAEVWPVPPRGSARMIGYRS